jgi:hypothetical protein
LIEGAGVTFNNFNLMTFGKTNDFFQLSGAFPIAANNHGFNIFRMDTQNFATGMKTDSLSQFWIFENIDGGSSFARSGSRRMGATQGLSLFLFQN